MAIEGPILSVCIPAYGRPDGLANLLASIDETDDLEIVVSEDDSPRRSDIRRVVANAGFPISYFENSTNLGYDANVRRLVELARGEFVIFMGDDDAFLPGGIGVLKLALRRSTNFDFVLRTYVVEHAKGRETFRYAPTSCELEAGTASATWLFKRCVVLGGFTIRRKRAVELATSDLDGSLLYQVYLMCGSALFSPSLYLSDPIVLVSQSYRGHKAAFGTSAAEERKYEPGDISHSNSIAFTNSFFEVANYVDQKFAVEISKDIVKQLASYSYPFLSIQRWRGRSSFWGYVRKLARETPLSRSPYFWFYAVVLLVFGESFCDKTIRLIKRVLGHTPNLDTFPRSLPPLAAD